MMKYLLFPFRLIWRVWFYLLIFLTMTILSPFFLALTSSEKNYTRLWKYTRMWSYFLIYAMGFRLEIEYQDYIDPDKSYLFCANHTSFLDPWMMIILSKNPIVFVGKEELTKMPIFGYFYKRSVITVDRSNSESRRAVYEKAKKRLQGGTSVAIFPEGLVPNEDVVLAPFKNGAFSLAIEHQIPIAPQVFFDGKRLFSWDFFKGHPGLLRIKQLKIIETKFLTSKDKHQLRNETYQIIEKELLNDSKYIDDTLKSKK